MIATGPEQVIRTLTGDTSEAVKTEVEALSEFNRKVARLARTAYIKLLEYGAEGATIEQFCADVELEWASPMLVKAAAEKLVGEELIAEVKRGKYAVAAASKPSIGKAYDVEVEKIYPGSAVVIVNDKWRARLDPYDYEGPASLMKKNSRFKAVAELYRMDGVLHVRIMDVVQKL